MEKTMKEFEVSKYVIKIRSLKKELGILAEPKAKTGKVLPQKRLLLFSYQDTKKKRFFIILFFLYHLSPTFAYFCISEITSTLINRELL